MKIKALSIREPAVSEILSGEKTSEYRSWDTKHRGDILICASKSPKGKYSGMAACLAEIIETKKAGGDWEWVLKNVRPIKKPFPVKGKLGFFFVEVPEDTI